MEWSRVSNQALGKNMDGSKISQGTGTVVFWPPNPWVSFLAFFKRNVQLSSTRWWFWNA